MDRYIMKRMYKNDFFKDCQMINLFSLVDDNSNKKLSIEEFFEIVDLIEKNE